MYLNRVTLISFIGSHAERKVANAANIATFSLATKTSYKDDAGSWESRTEWHRCVVFGRRAPQKTNGQDMERDRTDHHSVVRRPAY
jgi:single-strand DNA-binding protein